MPDEHLREAVLLAKQGQTAAALQSVKRHVRENMNDERGWYLLARLVSDERIKMEALERVLELNPYHEKARAMLRELDPRAQTFVFDNISLFDSAPSTRAVSAPQPDLFTEATYVDQVLPDVGSDFFRVAELPLQKQKAPAKAKSGGGAGEFWIGIGVILLAVMLAVGAGYYAYTYQHRGLFGLFGPDLAQVAKTGQFSIHYPTGWTGSSNAIGMVAANKDLSVLTNSNIENITAESVLSDPTIFNRIYGQDGLQMVLMVPVTPEVLAGLNANGLFAVDSGQDYVAQSVEAMEMFENEDQVKTDLVDQEIGGENGQLGYFEVMDEETDIALAVYFATTIHNGQEYMLMYFAINQPDENHGRLVKRILRSVEFTS